MVYLPSVDEVSRVAPRSAVTSREATLFALAAVASKSTADRSHTARCNWDRTSDEYHAPAIAARSAPSTRASVAADKLGEAASNDRCLNHDVAAIPAPSGRGTGRSVEPVPRKDLARDRHALAGSEIDHQRIEPASDRIIRSP